VHTLRSSAPHRSCRTQKMRTRNTMMDTMLSTMTAAAAMKRKSVNCSTTKPLAYVICLSLRVTYNRLSKLRDTFAHTLQVASRLPPLTPKHRSRMASLIMLYNVMTAVQLYATVRFSSPIPYLPSSHLFGHNGPVLFVVGDVAVFPTFAWGLMALL
jgi:hypothetical protein